MNAHDEPRELRPSDIRYKSGGAVEEIINSLTHAIGTELAIAGGVSYSVGVAFYAWHTLPFTHFASYIRERACITILFSLLRLPQIAEILVIAELAFYTFKLFVRQNHEFFFSTFSSIFGCSSITSSRLPVDRAEVAPTNQRS